MHKVLVIDSNLSSVKKIASELTKSGFETMVALPAAEGFKMAEEFSPDAIIVSDGSSQLDGFKLCQQIRRMFDLPLILLGDKPEEEVYTLDMKIPSDWDYYMHLPINYGELAARINVLLWRYGKAGRLGGSRNGEATEFRHHDFVITN